MSIYNISLKSNYLFGPTELSVIMPNPSMGDEPEEFYGSGKKFKVLWLLHGGLNDHHDWLLGTNIGRYVTERGVMAVIPNALNSDFSNHPGFADGYNFCDFFFHELMPFIYSWFPASADPNDNFLSGYSMGATGTWFYGLLHPEKFGGIAPLSSAPWNYSHLEPYRDMSSAEFRTRALANSQAFPAAYGKPGSGIHLKEINMITKFPTVGAFLDSAEYAWNRVKEIAAAGKFPKIYLPGSSKDSKLLEFKKYTEELEIKEISYDLSDVDAHCFEFWDNAIQKAMDFFGI